MVGFLEPLIWAAVGFAAAMAAGSYTFYARAGRPLPPDQRVAVDLRARRDAVALGARPTWQFDTGMVAGSTLLVLALTAGLRSLAAGGAFLALISLSGRLLVLGGRRRLRQLDS